MRGSASIVVTHTLNNLGKGDVLTHICNLDIDALALFGVGNDKHETTLNPSDAISLFADVFDFDSTLFTFFDRWL